MYGSYHITIAVSIDFNARNRFLLREFTYRNTSTHHYLFLNIARIPNRMALRVISIITAGHCLCNYEDYEPTASVYCKENALSSDAENTDPYNFVPVNQHLGPYQPLENNGLANAIYALFGSKDLNDISENKWLARDAYVMSAIKTDGKVILSGDDAYDLGIARFEVPSNNQVFQDLELKSLRLPPP